MKTDTPDAYMERKKYPINKIMLAHMFLSSFLSHLVYAVMRGSEAVSVFVDSVIATVGTVVHGMLGLSQMASDPGLAKIYLLFMWAGFPMYFVVMWHATPYVYYRDKRHDNPKKFWTFAIGGFLASLLPFFFPRVDAGPSAVRAVATIDRLMGEFYLLFMVMGLGMVLAASVSMSMSIRMAILRISDKSKV